jgi:hypothetical protein
MSSIREVFLSLNDVEAMILDFEQKYGMSSADFFRDVELRKSLPEDDVFRWEAFIDHRSALRETHEEVHREYLTNVRQSSDERRLHLNTQELLAA